MPNDPATERIQRIGRAFKQFDSEYWAFVERIHHAARQLGLTHESHEHNTTTEFEFVGEPFRLGLRLVMADGEPLGEIYIEHLAYEPDGRERRRRVGQVYLDETGGIAATPGGSRAGDVRSPHDVTGLLVRWLDGWLNSSEEIKVRKGG